MAKGMARIFMGRVFEGCVWGFKELIFFVHGGNFF